MDRRAKVRAAPRRTALRVVDVRAETGAVAQEEIVRTADLAKHGIPREVFGALQIAKVETLERTDSI